MVWRFDSGERAGTSHRARGLGILTLAATMLLGGCADSEAMLTVTVFELKCANPSSCKRSALEDALVTVEGPGSEIHLRTDENGKASTSLELNSVYMVRAEHGGTETSDVEILTSGFFELFLQDIRIR